MLSGVLSIADEVAVVTWRGQWARSGLQIIG
jgi:hypothetical protein